MHVSISLALSLARYRVSNNRKPTTIAIYFCLINKIENNVVLSKKRDKWFNSKLYKEMVDNINDNITKSRILMFRAFFKIKFKNI